MTPKEILKKLAFHNRQLDYAALDLKETLDHIFDVGEKMDSLEFDYYLRTGRFPE